MSDPNVGDVVRVTTTPGFTNAAGVLTDPTTVTLRWRPSGGAETAWVYLTNAAVVRDSVGVYHADITPTVAGLHYFRWEGTGAVTAAEEGTFNVETIMGADIALPSYADLGRLLRLFETRPNASRYPRLASLLRIATAQVIEACGHRDYFPHPTTGTAAWYVNGPLSPRRSWNDRRILHVHEGITSLTGLEISQDQGGSYTSVVSTDYVLRGDDPESSEPIPAGEPYFHVVFTGLGSIVSFPQGVNVIRPTGIRGWPAVPEALVEATVQRARQLAYAEGSYSGSQAGGQDEYGRPVTTDRFWPQSLWNFLQAEHSRFMGCRA